MLYSVAIIGAGYMADEYIRILVARVEFRVVGLVGRTTTRAQELANRYHGLEVFSTIEELFNAKAPDLVIVAVSELETHRVLKEIWKFPWTCIVEKPAGHNLEEAKKILEDSKNAAGKTFLALNRRYYESTLAAQKALLNVEGPRFINLVDQHDTQKALALGVPEKVVDNWHFANAIHTVDLLRVFSRGEVSRLEKSKWSTNEGAFVVCAKVYFTSGDQALYTSFWNTPNNWSLSVSTQELRVTLSPLEFASIQLKGERNSSRVNLEGRDIEFKPGLSQLLDDARESLKGNNNNLVTLIDGYKSMKLIQEIFESEAIPVV